MRTGRFTSREYDYIKEVIDNQFCSSAGAVMMQRLEKKFSETWNMKYAISHINGTATLHSILEGMGIGEGDEVIVPPLTMSSTAFAVMHANATPIFADIDAETFLIDPASIKDRITPNTKAVITVSLYGLSPDMDKIMKLAEQYNIFVIEDNAQCFLGKYKGRLVGTIGHAASYSFQSSKHIASGEGGMVVTNDLALAKNIRKVSSLGYAAVDATKSKITKTDIQSPDYSRHVSMGWNYRIPELCAAVALAQLENIDELVNIRKKSAQAYMDVSSCGWLTAQKVPDGCEHSYWSYVLKLDTDKVSWKEFRDKYMEYGGDGIYAAWKLTYMEPLFTNLDFLRRERYISETNRNSYKEGLCPVAEMIQPKLLQFKTNYWDEREMDSQAEILKKTIDFFN